MKRLKVGVGDGGIGARHLEACAALPDLFELAAAVRLPITPTHPFYGGWQPARQPAVP